MYNTIFLIEYCAFKERNVGNDERKNIKNNRKIINGLFEELNLSSQKEDIMRLIDKFDKMGKDNVVACLLDDYKLDQNICDRLINFLNNLIPQVWIVKNLRYLK